MGMLLHHTLMKIAEEEAKKKAEQEAQKAETQPEQPQAQKSTRKKKGE